MILHQNFLHHTTNVGAHRIQNTAMEKWRQACAHAKSQILLSANHKEFINNNLMQKSDWKSDV